MFTKYMIRQKTIVTIPTPRDRDTSALVRTVRVSTLDSFPSFLAFSNCKYKQDSVKTCKTNSENYFPTTLYVVN